MTVADVILSHHYPIKSLSGSLSMSVAEEIYGYIIMTQIPGRATVTSLKQQ